MKIPKVYFSLFLLLMLSTCLLCSCRTVEVRTEYVEVTPDYVTLIQPITEMRPDDVVLIDAPADLSDIMSNSVAFQFAYENWKDYALALEELFRNLAESQT